MPNIEKMMKTTDAVLRECNDLTIEEFMTIIPMVFDCYTAKKGMESEETIAWFENILTAMKAAHEELGKAVV